MKQLKLIVILLTTAMMFAACSSDSFRLEARIEGLGTQNVQIVYATSDGVQSDWVTANDDRLSYEGFAPELTVLQVLDSDNRLIARMAVKNGDKLKFRGTLTDPMGIEFKGSDASEEWSKFIKENKELYDAGNQPMLDIAIEKFIRENPDNVVSTLLLLFDYGSLMTVTLQRCKTARQAVEMMRCHRQTAGHHQRRRQAAVPNQHLPDAAQRALEKRKQQSLLHARPIRIDRQMEHIPRQRTQLQPTMAMEPRRCQAQSHCRLHQAAG